MMKNKTNKKLGLFRQVFASVLINFMLFFMGVSWAYSAQLLDQLHKSPMQDHESMTDTEDSWIGSAGFILCPIAAMIGGYLIDSFGRKPIVLSVFMLLASGWLFISFAPSLIILLIGRSIVSFAIGNGFSSFVFITEISESKWRGVNLSLGVLFEYIGCACVNTLNYHLTWRSSALIFALASLVLFASVLLFVPESPYYYMIKNNSVRAREALAWYRGGLSKEVEEEFKNIEEAMNSNENSNWKALLELCKESTFWKLVAIIVSFTIAAECTGYDLIVPYSTDFISLLRVNNNTYANDASYRNNISYTSQELIADNWHLKNTSYRPENFEANDNSHLRDNASFNNLNMRNISRDSVVNDSSVNDMSFNNISRINDIRANVSRDSVVNDSSVNDMSFNNISRINDSRANVSRDSVVNDSSVNDISYSNISRTNETRDDKIYDETTNNESYINKISYTYASNNSDMDGLSYIMKLIAPYYTPAFLSVAISYSNLFGAILVLIVVEKFDRKIILIGSNTLMALLMIVAGIQQSYEDEFAEKYSFVSVICLLLNLFLSPAGCTSVPWIVVGELLPCQVKGVLYSLLSGIFFIVVFGLTKISPWMMSAYPVPVILWFFALSSAVTVAIVAFYIPETRGRELHEIQKCFESDREMAKNGTKKCCMDSSNL